MFVSAAVSVMRELNQNKEKEQKWPILKPFLGI